MRVERKPRLSRADWFKEYVLGLAAGSAGAIYGIVAIIVGRTYLPSHWRGGGGRMVTGPAGFALALAYVAGGLYLVVHFFVDRRVHSVQAHNTLYVLRMALLALLGGAVLVALGLLARGWVPGRPP